MADLADLALGPVSSSHSETLSLNGSSPSQGFKYYLLMSGFQTGTNSTDSTFELQSHKTFVYFCHLDAQGHLKPKMQQSKLFSITSDLFLSPPSWQIPFRLIHIPRKTSGSHLWPTLSHPRTFLKHTLCFLSVHFTGFLFFCFFFSSITDMSTILCIFLYLRTHFRMYRVAILTNKWSGKVSFLTQENMIIRTPKIILKCRFCAHICVYEGRIRHKD